MAEKNEQADPERMVRVRVHKAVAFGGIVLRPTVDGKKTIPVEAEMPLSVAKTHGTDYVEVLGAVKQAAPAADKQVTGGKDK